MMGMKRRRPDFYQGFIAPIRFYWRMNDETYVMVMN